ncbi:uncharacterized protein PV09_03366 [Verruconis gallopava]|uniref:Uncharacterized protein n=1 Tax=Verruconis gallopava TaxID=253628 RepID=A0A0D1YXS3_9PEZI|nr:uncharacterized protein PV09_03366 [Verruconis gallopava]KIW05482.1 hypothetical protein PV09_03366 [Verruconis gallopava]
MNFYSLVAPPVGGSKRSKKDVAKAILQIPKDDHSNNLMFVAESLARHEVLDKRAVVRALARHLEAQNQLQDVRLLSMQIADVFVVEGGFHGLFRRLYVSPMYTNPFARRSRTGFSRVAYGCTEIIVSLRENCGNYRYAPGSIFQTRAEGMTSAVTEINDWSFVFRHCPNLKTLSVITGGCTTGVLWNRTSSALRTLRTGLEDADLPNMTTLRMAPVDMVYVGQFGCHGPAFGRSSAFAATLWTQIKHLELQILPLADLEENQRIQTFEKFREWLRGLALHLRSLRICYLGVHEGHNPFQRLSGLNRKRLGEDNVYMPELRELWLGRVEGLNDSYDVLKTLAPRLVRYASSCHVYQVFWI